MRDEEVSLNGGYRYWGHEWRRVPAPCEATRCQGGVMSECGVEGGVMSEGEREGAGKED